MPSYSYVLANAFKTAEDALSAAMAMNTVVNFVFFLAGLILELVPFTTTRSLVKQLGWIIRFWPPYAMSEGVRRVLMTAYTWTRSPPEDYTDEQFKECEAKYEKHEVPPHDCCRDLFDK